MKNITSKYYEEILLGLAFVLLAALAGIFVWSTSSLVVHMNSSLSPADVGHDDASFHISDAEKLNLQLTP